MGKTQKNLKKELEARNKEIRKMKLSIVLPSGTTARTVPKRTIYANIVSAIAAVGTNVSLIESIESGEKF